MTAFLHTELLASLKERVRKRQDEHRLSMAKGLPVEQYRELVGRHKECADLIDAIEAIAEENDDDELETAGGRGNRA